MDTEEYRQAIKEEYAVIEAAHARIDNLAKCAIPEFHWLNHKVSDFWSNCEKSPIGWCVWDVSERGFHIDCECHYCGEPVERK